MHYTTIAPVHASVSGKKCAGRREEDRPRPRRAGARKGGGGARERTGSQEPVIPSQCRNTGVGIRALWGAGTRMATTSLRTGLAMTRGDGARRCGERGGGWTPRSAGGRSAQARKSLSSRASVATLAWGSVLFGAQKGRRMATTGLRTGLAMTRGDGACRGIGVSRHDSISDAVRPAGRRRGDGWPRPVCALVSP